MQFLNCPVSQLEFVSLRLIKTNFGSYAAADRLSCNQDCKHTITRSTGLQPCNQLVPLQPEQVCIQVKTHMMHYLHYNTRGTTLMIGHVTGLPTPRMIQR